MIFYTILFLSSVLLTGVIRHFALVGKLMDIPNERSSHQVPTPRGGGMAFVLVFLSAMLVLSMEGLVSAAQVIGILTAGIPVAVAGFLDDKFTLAAKPRITVHFTAAVLALYIMGGIPTISLYHWIISPGLLLNLLGTVYLVWILNLFNFMDGIDGLAALEAVFVGFAAAVIYFWQGQPAAVLLPLSLAAAAAGFLLWNFPPARIFMGDLGSGFLGITLGIMSLYGLMMGQQYLWSWLILMGVFIVDATVTLVRRAWQRQRIWQAHCSHAYQHAARHFGNHKTVTLGVLMINVFWLFPWAFLTAAGILGGLTGLCLAWLPLFGLAVVFRAGRN